MRNRQLVFGLSLLVLAIQGCGGSGKDYGPTGTVEGTVTLDGSPLSSGSIVFYNEKTGDSGGGELDAEGKFKFAGALPVGTYNVTFPGNAMLDTPPDDAEADMRANQAVVVPQKYQDSKTSGFNEAVREGPNTFAFELKS